MRYLYPTLSIVLFAVSTAFSQDCEAIAQENQALRQEVAELRQLLNINTPVTSFDLDKLKIGLLSAVGDSRTQTVTVEVLFTNTGINIDRMTTSVYTLVLPDGTEVVLDKAILGAKVATSGSIGIFGSANNYVELLNGAPLKCQYIFKGVESRHKLIKALALPFEYHRIGSTDISMTNEQVVFTDVTIDWKS